MLNILLYGKAQRQLDTRMYVEYCQVKITSCVQYLNGCPLRSCPHQANCLACAPANITLFCMNI